MSRKGIPTPPHCCPGYDSLMGRHDLDCPFLGYEGEDRTGQARTEVFTQLEQEEETAQAEADEKELADLVLSELEAEEK